MLLMSASNAAISSLYAMTMVMIFEPGDSPLCCTAMRPAVTDDVPARFPRFVQPCQICGDGHLQPGFGNIAITAAITISGAPYHKVRLGNQNKSSAID
jgi:hypothetical protein